MVKKPKAQQSDFNVSTFALSFPVHWQVRDYTSALESTPAVGVQRIRGFTCPVVHDDSCRPVLAASRDDVIVPVRMCLIASSAGATLSLKMHYKMTLVRGGVAGPTLHFGFGL